MLKLLVVSDDVTQDAPVKAWCMVQKNLKGFFIVKVYISGYNLTAISHATAETRFTSLGRPVADFFVLTWLINGPREVKLVDIVVLVVLEDLIRYRLPG